MGAAGAAARQATAGPSSRSLAWPRRDGWFVDRSSDAVNVGFNALAAIVLGALVPDAPAGRALATALIEARGMKLPQSPSIRAGQQPAGLAVD